MKSSRPRRPNIRYPAGVRTWPNVRRHGPSGHRCRLGADDVETRSEPFGADRAAEERSNREIKELRRLLPAQTVGRSSRRPRTATSKLPKQEPFETGVVATLPR